MDYTDEVRSFIFVESGKAEKLVIASEEGVVEAASRLGEVKRTLKDTESKMKADLAPLKKEVKTKTAEWKALVDPLKGLEGTYKDKIGAYKLQEFEEKEALEAEAIKKQEQLNKKFAEVCPDGPVPQYVVPEYESKIKTDDTTVTVKMTKDFELIDFSLVPDEYKLLDESKIKKAIAVGVEIPGVKVIKDASVIVRA